MCFFFFFRQLFKNEMDMSSSRNTTRCVKRSFIKRYHKLNEVEILKNIIKMEKSVLLKNFNSEKSIKHHEKIVKGNFSQSSIIFKGIGIGLQCVPNSVMSLIYNTIKPFNLWESEDLDQVLQSGNILYNSIGKKTTLLVSEVPRYIKLHETIYFLNYENCTLGCIFEDNIIINSVQLSKLSNLLTKYKYFLLILSDSCISVVNDNNTFWVFDPHSRDEEGFPSSSGTSVLIHFQNFIKFSTYISKKFLKKTIIKCMN